MASSCLYARPLFCGDSEVDQLGKIIQSVPFNPFFLFIFLFFTKIEVVAVILILIHVPVLEKIQNKSAVFHFRVIGLPSEEEWPTEVTLSRSSFPSLSPCPITDFVPEINEKGCQLLLVGPWLAFKFKASYRCLCFCWNLGAQQIVAGSSSMCGSYRCHSTNGTERVRSQRSEL